MKTVDYTTYMNDLKSFIQKHNSHDYKVITSDFQNNQYHKSYIFEDGSEFIEINYHEHYETIETTIHNIPVKTHICMVKHEYWSTDDSISKYWYESK